MPRPDFDSDTALATESETRVKKPPLYKVLIHNDNYTTMEFVVFVLENVFGRNHDDAFRLMLDVHVKGVGVAGIFTYEIAEMKVQKTHELARANEYPLLCTIEEEPG